MAFIQYIDPMCLDHKVILQERTQIPDEQGGWFWTWSEVREMWATIKPIKAEYVLNYMQWDVDITHEIKVRYDSDIVKEKRFYYDSRIFHIEKVIDPRETKNTLICYCREIVN